MKKCMKDVNGILREKLHHVITSNEDLQDLEVKIGNMTYADTRVTVKLEFCLRGAQTREEEDLDRFIQNWNNPSSGNNKIVKKNNDYILVGYKARNRKYPFIYLDHSTKKTFKTSFEGMKKKFMVKDVSEADKIAMNDLTNILKPLDDMMDRHGQKLKLAALLSSSKTRVEKIKDLRGMGMNLSDAKALVSNHEREKLDSLEKRLVEAANAQLGIVS